VLETTDEESGPTSPVLDTKEAVISTPPPEESVILGPRSSLTTTTFWMPISRMSCSGGMDNVRPKGSRWLCLGGACEFYSFPSQRRGFIVVGTDSTCEYMDGCEWREKKANEAATMFKGRKASDNVP